MAKFNVKNYWDGRYKSGGTSGWGSHDATSVNFKKDFSWEPEDELQDHA